MYKVWFTKSTGGAWEYAFTSGEEAKAKYEEVVRENTTMYCELLGPEGLIDRWEW